MTEAEWLACCNPDAMFSFGADRVDSQLLELFGCACCRRIFHLLADQRSRRAVEIRGLLPNGPVSRPWVGVRFRFWHFPAARYRATLGRLWRGDVYDK